MTKYTCNHCGKEMDINISFNDTAWYSIGDKDYCEYCVHKFHDAIGDKI